jgi:tetraacyldisaccharide-1-P 4'-kinase
MNLTTIQTHLMQRSWLSYTLYRWDYYARGKAERKMAKQTWKLPARIITNLVMGMRKTPVTIALAKLLQKPFIDIYTHRIQR